MMLIRRRIVYHDEIVDIKYFPKSDKPVQDMERLLKFFLGEMEDKTITELSVFMDGDFTVNYIGNYQIEYSLIDLLDSIPPLIKFYDQIDDSKTLSN